jgi:DNA polymerase I
MKFYNIGYETVNCPHPECKSNHPCPKLPHWVCTKNKSMESQFIGSLRDMRLGWYKRRAKDKTLTKEQQSWYKCVEQTIKVFMNAAYGFFAQKGNSSIFACPPASELIANIGRDIISATADEAKELGIKTIAGDTDSLIIEDTNVELIKKLQDWAFTQYKIDLELDKSYRFMCFSSRKKNYLGVQPNGEVDVKGMVGKKRHTPEYFKKAFSETKSILSNVQKLEDIESAKTKIRKIVLDCYRRLKRREWTNLDDLAFHMQLGKKMEDYVKNIPQHVKAARQLEREGYVLEAGSIISFIKANNPDGVVPLELARNIDVDVKKYTEFLRSTFEQILEPLEIDFDEILGFKKMDAFCKVEGKV